MSDRKQIENLIDEERRLLLDCLNRIPQANSFVAAGMAGLVPELRRGIEEDQHRLLNLTDDSDISQEAERLEGKLFKYKKLLALN